MQRVNFKNYNIANGIEKNIFKNWGLSQIKEVFYYHIILLLKSWQSITSQFKDFDLSEEETHNLIFQL